MDTLFRREESEVLPGFCHSEEWACRCAAEGHMAADAAGAKALVGVLKIIKGRHYDKTREPPWRAMEKRHPLWWLRHHLPTSFAGGTMGAQHCATHLYRKT